VLHNDKLKTKVIIQRLFQTSGDLLADPHKILNSRKNYFCELLAYTGRVVLGRPKCIQPSHLCQSTVPQTLRLLLGS
jgi:hypothetical protein